MLNMAKLPTTPIPDQVIQEAIAFINLLDDRWSTLFNNLDNAYRQGRRMMVSRPRDTTTMPATPIPNKIIEQALNCLSLYQNPRAVSAWTALDTAYKQAVKSYGGISSAQSR